MRAIYCYPDWFATVDVLSVAVKSIYQLTELSRGMGWQPPF
jgi:hypothetical protein